MRNIRIILGILISDIAGIIIVSVPMIIFLSLTNFFAGSLSGLPLLAVSLFLLVSLSLFILPFQLILIIAQILRTELNKYGIFSVAILGGLIGGGLFYIIIFSHFSVSWLYLFIYTLFGVLQSLIIQSIYFYIPQEWKMRPVE